MLVPGTLIKSSSSSVGRTGCPMLITANRSGSALLGSNDLFIVFKGFDIFFK